MQSPKLIFSGLQFVRAVLFVLVLVFIQSASELGTSSALVGLVVFTGIILAGKLVRSSVPFIRVAGFHLVAFALVRIGFGVANSFALNPVTADPAMDFRVARILEHLSFLGWSYGLGFVSTWLFWTIRGWLTAEALFLGGFFVWMLSGHRNYHLDAPKNISSLTWKVPLLQSWNVEPEHLILAIGVACSFLLITYFMLATFRPIFRRSAVMIQAGNPHWFVRFAVAPILVLALLSGYAYFLNQNYQVGMAGRANNGVDKDKKGGSEDDDPLHYEGADGQKKTPAAIVRLENDYTDNPSQPMLYFRDGSVSRYDQERLKFVIASSAFDVDVPRTRPDQPWVSLDSRMSDIRTEVTQSIYLIANHENPFAIDLPRSIRLLKNPKPSRFKMAYQALSYAPIVKPDQLIGREVGDPKWTPEIWEHYLRTPGSKSKRSLTDTVENKILPDLTGPDRNQSVVPRKLQVPIYKSNVSVPDENNEDLRYRAMAAHITKDYESPVMKASAVIQFLSENSIYTKKPKHGVPLGQDQTAPYLFAKRMRGYCTHFATAAVYMLRAAGVPARIGTGYFTDLTYAKDGHILLSGADRHAWPEIYVRDVGWVIFDVTPAQAENETAPVPDPKLLEELMETLDPADPLLVPPPVTDEERDKTPSLITLPNVTATQFIVTLCVLLTLFLFSKAWLRYSYRLQAPSAVRAKRAYAAFASTEIDLGARRRPGETRQEFSSRLLLERGVQAGDVTNMIERLEYDRPTNTVDSIAPRKLAEALATYRKSHTPTLGRRLLYWISLFNPRSLWRIGRW